MSGSQQMAPDPEKILHQIGESVPNRALATDNRVFGRDSCYNPIGFSSADGP